ncbi:MAG: hypothetical protein AAGL89_16355 [Pseudomonadota bacterium]
MTVPHCCRAHQLGTDLVRGRFVFLLATTLAINVIVFDHFGAPLNGLTASAAPQHNHLFDRATTAEDDKALAVGSIVNLCGDWAVKDRGAGSIDFKRIVCGCERHKILASDECPHANGMRGEGQEQAAAPTQRDYTQRGGWGR